MGKNNNIIFINGKSYDAKTGDLLVNSTPHKTSGMPTPKPATTGVDRQPAKHARDQVTQRSKTLMRHAVKKPSDSLKRHLKAQSGSGAVAKHASASVITKPSVNKLDNNRLKHAKNVPKSRHISRFRPVSASSSSSQIPVRHVVARHDAPIVAAHALRPKQAKTTADLLQQAIERSTSHEQIYSSAKKSFGMSRRSTRIGTLSAAAVIIMIIVVSQSLVAVRLHVASSKAGFAVNAPSYQPAGYSLSKLTYSAGNAGLHFTSNSDDRAFSITEKTTNWDSNTLRDLVVTPTSTDYQAIEASGRTIFLNNGNNATWVDKGVLYRVDTQGVLNEQQLVKIANSL